MAVSDILGRACDRSERRARRAPRRACRAGGRATTTAATGRHRRLRAGEDDERFRVPELRHGFVLFKEQSG